MPEKVQNAREASECQRSFRMLEKRTSSERENSLRMLRKRASEHAGEEDVFRVLEKRGEPQNFCWRRRELHAA